MDCSSAAALHNLTVYGTEILYTLTNNTMSGISFAFQLYNSLIDVDAQCSVHLASLASASAPDTAWPCFVESRDTSSRISAGFAFDLTARALTVFESWRCSEADSSTSVQVHVQGTSSIALLCSETVSAGQHYCAAVPAVPWPVGVVEEGIFGM